MASGGPSSATRSWGVVSLRVIVIDGEFLRVSSSLPPPYTLTSSTSSGTVSEGFPPSAGRRGNVGDRVYMSERASVQEEPVKIAIDVAGPAAFDERRETKSTLSDHDRCLTGN